MMSSLSSSTARPPLRERIGARHRAALAASVAALLLVVNGTIGLFGDVGDHTTGPGLVSELTAGLAFLAGAAALWLLRPVTGWRGALWMLAPVGLTVAGATMVGVPVTGSEPAEWLFALAVLPTFVGLVAAGLLGAGRVWPWWTGAGLAAFLPVMFLLPLNSFAMAAIWTGVALARQPVEIDGVHVGGVRPVSDG